MSFSFSSAAQPEAQGPSSLLDYGFLYCILSPTGLQNSIGGPEGPFGWVWLSLPHLVSDVSYPQLIRAPRVPSTGLSLPHLISNVSGPQLTDFLSSQSYIIVLRPLNRSLNLWNGMFDRHQAEMIVMQFTGHSLPVHQFMSVPWEFYHVPFHQPNPPTRSLSITGHWNVSLPSGASLWNGIFSRVEGQNTTDRRVSIETISAQFDVSVGTVYTIIHEELKMRKICAKFVPKELREDQKERRCHDSGEMLELINWDPVVLDALVTCNENWI